MTNLDALIRRVYQTVLDEHHGNADLALLDLAGRFVRQADGVAAGFVRYPPHRDPRPAKPAPPAIVDPGEDDGA
jgi:hypothetical protein